MVDRSTAPLEMFGEPDDTECPHGIPTGMGVECWECRYDQLKIDYDALEQECGELAERLQKLAAEIAEPSIKELDTLHRIRKAVGDTGKMMQDELVDKIQEIVSDNATLRKRREEAERERDELLQELGNLLAIIHRDGGHYMSKHGVKKAIKDAHTIWAGLIDLEAENALLRKRLNRAESEIRAGD